MPNISLKANIGQKILDVYQGYIETQIRQYPEITGAILHDHLMESCPELEVPARSVREFVAMLREELGLPTINKIRQYQEVAELPPGMQAQVDMGEKVMRDFYGKAVKVYIFAMVMSHSRKKFVCFQDHKLNAKEFVGAHDLAFRYFGGRTTEIAYDQDRVMAVSENAGDLVLTEEFSAYSRYAGFSIHLCRVKDPESKGNKYEALKAKVLENFEGVGQAEAYIGRLLEKYPRYIRDQLGIIKKAQERYTKPELEQALCYCVQRDLYSANDFRDTLEYFRQQEPPVFALDIRLPIKYSVVRAEIRPLSAYSAMPEGGGAV